MKTILLSWIGSTDLRASQGVIEHNGPILDALRARQFSSAVFLSNYPQEETDQFIAWVSDLSRIPITVEFVPLSSPMNFSEIYLAMRKVCKREFSTSPNAKFVYHISPGTSAMASVSILLAKSKYSGELIQASIEHGVETVSFPFELSADYLPDLIEISKQTIENLASTKTSLHENTSFDAIITRDPAMNQIIQQAKKISLSEVPVLIQGESGTGKELFARAVHDFSNRKDKPFIIVNCGAIPSELVESEFFGYEKGAFTGAQTNKIGYFESAHGGSIFLDEIGELPLPQQVTLLRVIQEGKIQRVGATQEISIDVRIISATNKNLIDEVAQGTFRNDLFYRIAIGLLQIPPLRERQGDLSLLTEHMIAQIDTEYLKTYRIAKQFYLTAEAKNKLYGYHWAGNVRELTNVLRRASLWSDSGVIEADDIQILNTKAQHDSPGNYMHAIQDGSFNIHQKLKEQSKQYISYALSITDGNKSKAAGLLGFNSYQTLSNWMKQLELE
jgi:transcriptional regulator with PAS, ATPase and Fis domain